MATEDGEEVLLDLERCAIGPPEWDLISTAIKRTSFAWITDADYDDFATATAMTSLGGRVSSSCGTSESFG